MKVFNKRNALLGWATWLVGKRVFKRKARAAVPTVEGGKPNKPAIAAAVAALGVISAGVTHRPLIARGEWPSDERGAIRPLRLDGEVVGYWLRTRAGMRPLAVHAAWGTSPDAAVDLVRSVT